jgi:hypothetical protein
MAVVEFILLCYTCALSALLAPLNAFPAPKEKRIRSGTRGLVGVDLKYIYINSGFNTANGEKR